jgi:hypothetical protein
VAGKRQKLGGIAALAASGLLVVAGCGGGDDDTTTTTTQAATLVPTVTAPLPRTTTGAAGGHGGGANPTPQRVAPNNPGGQRPGALLGALGPFQDCLSRHGVDPVQFRQTLRQSYLGGRAAGGAEARRRIEAGITCIPELPPQFRQQAERAAQRYQQQNG